MITYEIPRACYRCLCRACGEVGCPHRDYRYKRCYLCWRDHNYRPILDCENFYFKKISHRYKIRRIASNPKIRYIDKTNSDDIRIMLTEILMLLHNGNNPITDVNCIKNDCLCLHCDYFARCKISCDLCKSYKGEHPIKMCALKALRDKGFYRY